MDILANLLHDVGLRRRLLDLRRLDDAVALRFPCERSMGFHVVTRGRAVLHAKSAGKPLVLEAGDIAFMARGCEHLLATRESLRGLAVETIPVEPPAAAAGDGAPPAEAAAAVISGAYQLWSAPVHPFFRELPAWRVVRGATLPRLGPLSLAVALLGQEAAQREPGSALVVQSLLDMLFVYLLRETLAGPAGAGEGRAGGHAADAVGAAWRDALRDPPVRHAVELMHEASTEPWTLDTLARRVGLSRSVLAERFRAAVGDTPLNHLRTVRLQRAMRLLADTDDKLEAVAAAVGYGDAFSFSKAFRRTVGVAPGEFRQRERADRESPWRFAPRDALSVAAG